MPFQNLSFESLGSEAGIASSWVFSAHSQILYAPFPGGGSFESFESGWLNDSYKFSFVGLGTDLAAALFGTTTVENFEKEWAGNETYVYGFAGAAAQFHVINQPVEDFNADWSSNQNYKFAFDGTDLAVAPFDVTPESFEDFEEDWVTGYKFSFVGLGTDLSAASFDGTPEAFEDFEEDWPTINMVTI